MKDKMVLGADLGWVSQLESRGVTWVDDDGKQIDPIQAVKAKGTNTVRLRVFVNPPEEAFWKKKDGTVCMLGFADAAGVLEMSRRVREAGMQLMIDFHYSDHFADPQYQDIPEAWKEDDAQGLKARVYHHTKEVLTLLTDNGICPEWVQVGNEINPGILLPQGSLNEHPENLVAFLNAGYDAVKECCPECQVITHITAMYQPEKKPDGQTGRDSGSMDMFWENFLGTRGCERFLETFFRLGGKTDVIGFSHYPYWFRVDQSAEFLLKHLVRYEEQYHKPIMICEVGGPEEEAEETYELLANTIKALEQLPEGHGLGVVYWEPEVGAALLPDHYPLGAARVVRENTLQLTGALNAYKHEKI